MQLQDRIAVRIAPRPFSSAKPGPLALTSAQTWTHEHERRSRTQNNTRPAPFLPMNAQNGESTPNCNAAERSGCQENSQQQQVPKATSEALNSEGQCHQNPMAQMRDIDDLKRSHADMIAKVSTLEDNLRTHHHWLQMQSHRAGGTSQIHRTLQFARLRAVSAPHCGSKELNKKPHSLCEANSVVQAVLKSSPTDCTMQEFQELASLVRRKNSITCNFFPSDYAVLFPSVSRTCRLEIQFETYKDICDILQLDVHERETGVYREKGNITRHVRAIQLVGVDMLDGLDRKILLGRSFPSSIPGDAVPYLHQERAAWKEGSWEEGFSFKLGKLSSIANQRSTFQRRFSEKSCRQTSDLNQMPLEKCKFSLSWERFPGAQGTDAGSVPGFLRAFFPAVVLRSRILIVSTKLQFETRFFDKFPKELITTREQLDPQHIS